MGKRHKHPKVRMRLFVNKAAHETPPSPLLGPVQEKFSGFRAQFRGTFQVLPDSPVLWLSPSSSSGQYMLIRVGGWTPAKTKGIEHETIRLFRVLSIKYPKGMKKWFANAAVADGEPAPGEPSIAEQLVNYLNKLQLPLRVEAEQLLSLPANRGFSIQELVEGLSDVEDEEAQ